MAFRRKCLCPPHRPRSRPAHASDAHQFEQVDMGGRITEEVLDFGGVIEIAAQDQPALGAWNLQLAAAKLADLENSNLNPKQEPLNPLSGCSQYLQLENFFQHHLCPLPLPTRGVRFCSLLQG